MPSPHPAGTRRALHAAALAACLCATPAAAQPWLAALESDSTEHFELYAPRTDEVAKGRAELDHAVRAFQAAFGTTPPRIAVLLMDDNPPAGYDAPFRDRGLRVLVWLTDEGWTRQHHGAPTGPAHSELRILPHEACHLFFSVWADRRLGAPPVSAAPRTRTPHYGHPSAPDWLDEAAATACEHDDERARRRARMAERLEQRIPLEELFAMQHPLSGPLQVRSGSPTPPAAPGTRVGAMTFNSTLSPELMQRAGNFYAQASTLGAFLAERYGPGALGRLAEGILGGGTMAEALQAIGAPADPQAFEHAWMDWVRGG